MSAQNETSQNIDIIADATARQQRAADPFYNVWVDASAGSGKTKVLTDRVLCLLLSGAKPEEILCLTYTRAAANEMAGRVRQTLSKWAMADEKTLLQALSALPIAVNAETIQKAKQLFFNILDNPIGLQAQTIHGFCERILRQFPLEANLPLGFQVIEGSREKQLFAKAFEAMAAIEQTRTLLQDLSQHTSDSKLSELIEELVKQRRQLRSCFERYEDHAQLEQCLRKMLSVPEESWTQERLVAATLDPYDLKEMAAAYQESGKASDSTRVAKINSWLQQQDYSVYESLFLTQAGTIQSKLYLKDTPLSDSQKDILEAEAERVFTVSEERLAQTIFENSTALLKVALEACQIYEALKRKQNVVDYEDLIEKCVALLADETAVWVRYKLDQRINHILVDEAQDSSTYHWKLVDALIAEYNNPDAHRSFFVVGDYKQSIYSFQGAAPDLFRKQCEDYRQQYEALGNWREVGMNISFRSAQDILSFVDSVHNQTTAKQGVIFDALQHNAAWQDKKGAIECWPLIEKETVALPAWTLPCDREQPEDAEDKLCKQITCKIANWLSKKTTLDNQPDSPSITAGDILILLRRRGTLSLKLRETLVAAGIPVMDSDRLKLTDEQIVKDLLNLAKVMLCTQDDYSLACLLKSPIFNYSEARLFQLCHGREGGLWQALKQQDDKEILKRWRVTALYKTPYVFFTEVLFHDNIQQRYIDQFGINSVDIIRLFTERILEFEQQELPDLQGFILWMQQQDEPVKNELVRCGKVRVMTVHGSKGLESPIVILADTDATPEPPKILYFCKESQLYLYGKKAHPAIRTVAENMEQHNREEYHRLLYVAMTRAEHRLCITGIAANRKSAQSWYDYVSGLSEPIAVEEKGDPLINVTPPLEILPASHVKPEWFNTMAEPEPVVTAKSVTQDASNDNKDLKTTATLQGIEIHRLLQKLPHLAEEQWPTYVTDPELLESVMKVINNPDTQWIFSKNSQAEVPVLGYYSGELVEGRMDRLVVTDDAVHIIDYKTGTPTRHTNQRYIKQLLAYKSLIQKVYPTYQVKAWVLWTQNLQMDSIE